MVVLVVNFFCYCTFNDMFLLFFFFVFYTTTCGICCRWQHQLATTKPSTQATTISIMKLATATTTTKCTTTDCLSAADVCNAFPLHRSRTFSCTCNNNNNTHMHSYAHPKPLVCSHWRYVFVCCKSSCYKTLFVWAKNLPQQRQQK